MYQSDVAPLHRVLMKHPRDAYASTARIAEQWRDLHYARAPEFEAACREADALAELLELLGVAVEWLSSADTGMDSIYPRDASIVCDRGAVLCRMGKDARASEPANHGAEYEEYGIHVEGKIEAPGTLEGGDVTWLGQGTLAVGRGYRTNQAGLDQLRSILGDTVEVVEVPLPHWNGPNDVFHLMSMISPLAEDLALVYAPLLPVPFRELLLARGFDLIEVPLEEFESQGCNVLAVAPRVAVALAGSPETRARMERSGVDVHTFEGGEISMKGAGGPTCLTRTLERG